MPMLELDQGDIEVIRESLRYSKQRIADAQGTPYAVRRENLERVESVMQKFSKSRFMLAE